MLVTAAVNDGQLLY